MTKKRTEKDFPIPPDLVEAMKPTEMMSGDDWDKLFSSDETSITEDIPSPQPEEEEEGAPVSTRYLGFRLGVEHYAVPILHLSEVVRHQEITAVPRVRSFVRGIISVRGTIVPIVDLQQRLSQQGGRLAVPGDLGADADDQRRVLITAHEDEVFGLLVDAVSDVFVAEPNDIEPPPAALPRRLLDIVTGIARVQGRIHTVLDVPAVLRFDAVASGRSAEVAR